MIRGNKVGLRAVQETDIMRMMNWRNQLEIRSFSRERREINSTMQNTWFRQAVINNPNQVHFAIVNNDTDMLIGHCVLTRINWVNRNAEFGIYIGDSKYQGGGRGSDALRLLIKYGFEQLNLHRIYGEVFEGNPALNVFKHVGFLEEARMRQAHFMNGKYHDIFIVSILQEEWEHRYGKCE